MLFEENFREKLQHLGRAPTPSARGAALLQPPGTGVGSVYGDVSDRYASHNHRSEQA